MIGLMGMVAIVISSWLLATSALPVQQPAAHGSTQDPRVTIIGPLLPVATLRELWDRTPVVALVVVRHRGAPTAENNGVVVRLHTCDVRTVLKDEEGVLNDGRHVTVKQYGGTAHVDGREFRTIDHAPPLHEGAAAVLFMKRLSDQNVFIVPDSFLGSYPIGTDEAGTVSISQSARSWPELGDRSRLSKTELLSILHTLPSGR